jgi:L-2-hydroxycarboxylate dehydrogenase (NAD+)
MIRRQNSSIRAAQRAARAIFVEETSVMLLTADAERRYLEAIFTTLGMTAAEAAAVADVLTEADLRGHTSHGIVRVSLYAGLLRSGRGKPNAQPRIVQDTGVAIRMDGDRGLGPFVAIQATNLAISRAKERGVAAITIDNCGHLGLAGYYVELAARQDLVGILFAKSATHIHPYGGVERRIGTNPISIAIPTEGDPFLLDMSTSAIANGKLQEAAREGRPLPEGAALDKDGAPTTDAQAALTGALTPFGGAKGYGLALVVELLGGLLAGSGTGELRNPDGTGRLWGALIMVLDPAAFGDVAEFKRGATQYLAGVKNSRRAPGFADILIPGERSFRTRGEQLERGITIEDGVWTQVAKLAAEIGVDAQQFVGPARSATKPS